MKHEIVIASTSLGVTTTSAAYTPEGRPINGISADINASEAGQLELYTKPVLGAAETVTVFIVSADGAGLVPARDAFGVTALLDPTHQSILLPGGYIYRLVKTATVAPTAVEYYMQARAR